MKKSWSFVLPALFPLALIAEPEIQDVTARQRWPWSGKVDVDFVLAGADACDVEFEATWSGISSPISLKFGNISTVVAQPGENHLVWDPAEEGYGAKTLAGFSVRVRSLAKVSERKYLVLDLQTGAAEFCTSLPEDLAENGFKGVKMAFRRIPAGNYWLGYDDDQLSWLLANDPYFKDVSRWRNAMGRREVRVTSDYYMAIFQTTTAQQGYARGSSASGAGPTKSLTLSELRGTVADGVNWPKTGHACKPGSFLDDVRKRIKIPDGWLLDLPTEAQWEIAARAGTETLTPNGGTTADSPETVMDIIRSIAIVADSGDVGTKSPNPWGLYDVLGMTYEWVLDVYDSADASGLVDCYDFRSGFRGEGSYVDPTGPESALTENQFHLSCNVGWGPGVSPGGTVCNRRAYRDDQMVSYRLCININPVVK